MSVSPGLGAPDGHLSSIVMNPSQFAIYQGGSDGSVTLSPSAQANLKAALGSDQLSKLCGDLAEAITIGEGLWSTRANHALYVDPISGLIATSFNSFSTPRPSLANEQRIGTFGVSANVFYGIPDTSFVDNRGQVVLTRPSRPRGSGRPRRRRTL